MQFHQQHQQWEREMESKQVYSAIAEVTELLSKEGISKDKKNVQQGYAFRGIDDVYNALAPFLAKCKLCILPNVISRDVVERQTKSGSALFYVTVKVDFSFVSAQDSSEHHVITYGEAMDSGDKATNKAMSAAYKYACMQAFCIPTEGDNDADKHTHEVAPAPPKAVHSPTDGALAALSADDQKEANSIASQIVDLFAADGEFKAYELYYQSNHTPEMMLAVWEILRPHSKIRSSLKAMNQPRKVA